MTEQSLIPAVVEPGATPLKSAKQEAFAHHYAVHRNGSEAYRQAFDCENSTAKTICTEASYLVNDPIVSRRIEYLTEQHAQRMFGVHSMTIEKLLQMEVEIATADPRDVCEWKVSPCRRCWGEAHKYQWIELEYIEALETWDALPKAAKDTTPIPDLAGGFGYDRKAAPNPSCPFCAGRGEGQMVIKDSATLGPGARRLFAGVKQSRQGVEVLLRDQEKARENIGRMLGAYKDSLRLGGGIGVLNVAAELPADPQAAEQAYRQMMDG